MIAQFHQSKSRPASEYVITSLDGHVLGNAENPDGKSAVLRLLGREYQFRFELETMVCADGVARHCFPFFCQGQQIGAIEHHSNVRKVRFLKWEGFHYQLFPVGNDWFELCEVGLGRERHYFCLHRNGITSAIVHMSDKEKDFCNDYMIYAEDENAFIAASIATLYKDNIMEEQKKYRREYVSATKVLDTPDASLRARFDPDFIPRIQARDGRN